MLRWYPPLRTRSSISSLVVCEALDPASVLLQMSMSAPESSSFRGFATGALDLGARKSKRPAETRTTLVRLTGADTTVERGPAALKALRVPIRVELVLLNAVAICQRRPRFCREYLFVQQMMPTRKACVS